MQKKRPRLNGDMGSGTPIPAATGAQDGRRKRVRNRLAAGVAVVGITVIGAGAPAVLHGSAELKDAQRLVTLAELNRQTVTFAHSLADERDQVIVFIATGRDRKAEDGDGRARKVPGTHNVRVDRQLEEIRATASAPPGLLRDLSTVSAVRGTALTGKGSALDAYRAYSGIIAKLYALADELAEKTPPDVADSSRAPAALDRAVEQASAARGLLLAALAVPEEKDTTPQYDPITGLLTESSAEKDNKKNARTRDALSSAAQQARVRELAAFADFDDTAGSAARDSVDGTVTGPDVTVAESYLSRFTDRPELSDEDLKADQEKVESALSARIDQMRAAESGLGTAQLERLENLRDSAVTSLELRIALLGGCLLIAVGVSTAAARTLTQPLAALRIGAARLSAAPESEAAIRYNGRNDEFAQAIRSVNALHSRLLELSTRTEKPRAPRTDLMGAAGNAAAQRAELQDRTAELTAQLEQLRHTVHHSFVNLSLRTLGLVEHQLGVIETMEERAQDPEGLATLFQLDHLATVMRRHTENLLLLAGHEQPPEQSGPVPLVDVLRAAVSEIERYDRVVIQPVPTLAQVVDSAADDLSHLIAELLENAASFSPPDAQVRLSASLLESGEAVLTVQDQGIGMPADRLAELNARLADPEGHGPASWNGPGRLSGSLKAEDRPRNGSGTQNGGRPPTSRASESETEGLGLRVAGLLAARHRVRVELREQLQGGVAAVVTLPPALLPKPAPAGAPFRTGTPGAAPTVPGSAAEAKPDAQPARSTVDPMVAAAEHAIRKAEAEAQTAEARPGTVSEARPGTVSEAWPGTVSPAVHEPVSPAVHETVERPTPYAIGPDAHERVLDGEPKTAGLDQDTFMIRRPQSATETPTTVGPAVPGPRPDADRASPAPSRERPTVNGLPKRHPSVVKATSPSAERTGGVDAEALRRRVGGFHHGAKNGRCDVEAELAEPIEETGLTGQSGIMRETQVSGARTEQIASDEENQALAHKMGETAEEALS